MAEKRPLLDIEVFIRRPRVTIDGAFYEMYHPDELTILGRQRQIVRIRRVQELLRAEELTATEQAEIPSLVDEACRVVLMAPDDVHSSLRDGQRMAVLDRFGVLSWFRRRAARAMRRIKTASWASSYPAWFVSMAVLP